MVLEAAANASAQTIVTYNLKDHAPARNLGILMLNPRQTLTNLICANPLDLLLKAQAISSDALRLSEFLKSASKRIAAADDTTLNQFFVVFTVEKISAMETADFFQRRSAGALGEFKS